MARVARRGSRIHAGATALDPGRPCVMSHIPSPSESSDRTSGTRAKGAAHRWADLAVATWSLAWNYGDGFDAEFFAAYGISRDPERVRYYRLLWDFA